MIYGFAYGAYGSAVGFGFFGAFDFCGTYGGLVPAPGAAVLRFEGTSAFTVPRAQWMPPMRIF